jgi:hypothetical protein
MRYFRLALCVIGAISIALFVPNVVREVSLQRQTGIGVVAGGLEESLFSPLFWILAVLCFLLFRWASRNRQALVRVLLFWIPSVASSVLGIALFGLFTYMYLHFRQT